MPVKLGWDILDGSENIYIMDQVKDLKNNDDYSMMEKELKNERNSIKDMIKDAKEKSEKQVIKNVIKNKDLML